jgi:hypothetical protein
MRHACSRLARAAPRHPPLSSPLPCAAAAAAALPLLPPLAGAGAPRRMSILDKLKGAMGAHWSAPPPAPTHTATLTHTHTVRP